MDFDSASSSNDDNITDDEVMTDQLTQNPG
jgi:hypothetical protein